jgi:signal transduction histidine kinase
MSASLASRVAWVQAIFTVAAVSFVALGTSVSFRALLAAKADEQLSSVSSQVASYLGSGSLESLDWKWFAHEVDEHRPADVRVEVSDASGRSLFASGPNISMPAAGVGCADHAAVRSCATALPGLSVAAARDGSPDLALRQQFDLALFAACGVVSVAAAFGSRAITRRAIKPLSELALRVQALEPGTGGRIEPKTGLSELDALGASFDALVARFEQALSREKRFAAQASHELRTPLTVARAEIEALMRGEQEPGTLARSLAAIDRLVNLVQALLWFARAQERLDDGRMELVNVADLVRAQLENLRVVHSEAHFSCDLPDEALVRGDEGLVSRALANLLENAIKHGDGGPVEVRMTRDKQELQLSVKNAGSAIPMGLREQIFLPFFRGKPGTDATGFGLGLPLARAVARAHGGDVALNAASIEQTEMILSLPLVAWHQAEASSS